MKVKCEYAETGGICTVSLKEATTADLIAELERRRPDCASCLHSDRHDWRTCAKCIWDGAETFKLNNFKSSIEGKIK